MPMDFDKKKPLFDTRRNILYTNVLSLHIYSFNLSSKLKMIPIIEKRQKFHQF